MTLKTLIRKYYKAYLERKLDVVKEILDPKFEAISGMMKFHNAQDYLDGSWSNSENLVDIKFELEVIDEEKNTAFYVLKWDFGNSKMETAEYLEVRDEKITKIVWINMSPDFYSKIIG